MAEFDAIKPPVAVTNPGVTPAAPADADYPRHVHKGYGPTYEYCVVKNDEEKAAALADGYALVPEGPPAKTKPAPKPAPADDADEPDKKHKGRDR